METFSNQLSAAEAERLAILSEELGEAQQCIGKILRHGYESYNPIVNTGMTNRRELERELGDVYAAIEMLGDANDVSMHGVGSRMITKKREIKKWTHPSAMSESTLRGMLEWLEARANDDGRRLGKRAAYGACRNTLQPLADQLQAVVERIPCEFGVEDDEPCDCVRHQLDRILGTPGDTK